MTGQKEKRDRRGNLLGKQAIVGPDTISLLPEFFAVIHARPPALALRFFGPFEARRNGEPLPRLRTRKGSWLLALLTLRSGREVERSFLAGTLWADSPEPQALASLRKSLSDLRAALGDEARRLRSPTPHSLLLDLSGAAVDLLAFDAAIESGSAGGLEDAARLYRGPLLEGCAEEWILPERQAREEAYLGALEQLAAGAMAAGEPMAAVSRLQRVAALDPLRETAQRELMRALARGGNAGAAVQVYRDLRLRLYQELKAEPAPETTALFQQIRAEARQQSMAGGESDRDNGGARSMRFATHPPAPRSLLRLPRPLTEFVGRERELREIVTCLARRRTGGRLLTLTGSGGVGKTRLAIEVAERQVEEYRDGVCFVDLARLGNQDLVPQAVAAALGMREEPGRELLATLVEAQRPMQLLLVLDNCEHLVEACAALAEALLAGCPQLWLLATSRQPLRIAGETDWRVPTLSLPPAIDCPEGSRPSEGGIDPSILGQSEAVQLFVQRAVAARPSFAVTERNAGAVVQICRRLDGIPLAIELAAARLKVLSAEQIAVRLAEPLGTRCGLLTSGSRTALPRQQTLRATLDWSCDLLSEPERELLLRLSIFAGWFTLEAAEAVCGDEREKGGHEVLDLLTQLVEKSLVWVEEWDGEARYRLLETTREYAGELLDGSGEAAWMGHRHRAYFLGLAEESAALLPRPERGRAFDRLEAAHDDLRAALAWSTRPNSPEAAAALGLELAAALVHFWFVRGHWTEGRRWLAAALAGGSAPTEARACAMRWAGVLAREQRDFAAARALCEAALAMSQAVGEPNGIADAFTSLAWAVHSQADYARARCLHGESLRIRRATGDRTGVASSLLNLGGVACAEGDYKAARALHEQALELAREIGDQGVIAYAADALGEDARAQGDLPAATAFYTESLVLFHQLGHRAGIASGLRGLAMVAVQALGSEYSVRRAAQLLGAADSLYEALGSHVPRRFRAHHAATLAALRASLGADSFAAARAKGGSMTLAEAVAYALEEAAPTSARGEQSSSTS